MLINLMYGDDCTDCDIIFVPDEIGKEIETYAQQFCDWLGSDSITDEYYVNVDGKKCINLETDGFVRWINNYICKEFPWAHIESQHVQLNSRYKTVEF